ncbi:MAG: hypothetical protein LBC70_00570 [Chitinispirillales bacterium]|jgi:hypothetical protein|nr:hypothetical protein [Chitinispirillales bacterium]
MGNKPRRELFWVEIRAMFTDIARQQAGIAGGMKDAKRLFAERAALVFKGKGGVEVRGVLCR